MFKFSIFLFLLAYLQLDTLHFPLAIMLILVQGNIVEVTVQDTVFRNPQLQLETSSGQKKDI